MKSFVQYICEENNIVPGNYVSATCDLPVLPQELMPVSGKRTDNNSAHITLIYSQHSNVDHKLINTILGMVTDKFPLTVDHFECFDAVPKEGEHDENKCTLVAKVKSAYAVTLHDTFKTLGMEHSYPEFSPHISIAYDVDREEGYQVKDKLNAWLLSNPISITVETKQFEVKAIDKDWVKKL